MLIGLPLLSNRVVRCSRVSDSSMGNIKPFTGQDGVRNALSTLSLKEFYKQSAAKDSIGIKVSRKESVHQRN